MVNNLLLEKYKPKSVYELTCNTTSINTIIKWLNDFEKQKYILNSDQKTKSISKSCLILSGSHGIGKTVSIETMY